ncbi:MAG: hypothetical protein WB951_20055, partial [Candidatus Sulfotelmatobacter sp.]
LISTVEFPLLARGLGWEHEIVFTRVRLAGFLADGSGPPTLLVTPVTFEPARHTASILFRTLGC